MIVALGLTWVDAATGPARAEEPAKPAPAEAPPRGDDSRAAAQAFEEGERAFRAGDFARAAAAFEAAYRAASHASPLWNAARSWHRAGEISRAANLYARYLREAPSDAPDRDAAGAALGQIAPRLGRIDVYAPGARDVRVDDVPVESGSVYVNPGSHVVAAQVGAQVVRRTEGIGPGEVRSVALVAASAPTDAGGAGGSSGAIDGSQGAAATRPTPDAAAPLGQRAAPDAGTPPATSPLMPAAVIAGATLTAITAGLTIASGLDTLAARDTFDAAPTQDNLDAGRDKQRRTNVLLGASIGLGVLTGAAAVWLVARGASTAPPTPARRALALGLAPTGIAVGGVF